MVRIALDVMGGDFGANAVIAGVSHFLSHSSVDDVFFSLFGDKSKIDPLLEKFSGISAELYDIHDTGDKVITPGMKPSSAVRGGQGTSMFEAISHVARGEADAVVSSGNTGAYMALSRIILNMIDGIERPAIVSVMPYTTGRSVMLDLGANTECSSTNLIQFAFMGRAVAEVLLKIENPSIGLLNIGTEKAKGTDSLKEAFNFLEKSEGVNFVGFIEGTDITKGTADVIVTDGFSGNISLKTMEGTIRYLYFLLQKEIKASFLGKIGFLLCKGVFSKLREAIDPRNHNGASFVGLQGIAIKSHGSSDYVGFSHAISVAVELARSGFVKNIIDVISSQEMEKANEHDNN